MTEPVDELTDAGASRANVAFYEALESGGLEKMVAVWSHGDDVLCAHPGRTPLRGWADVLHSWQLIFGSGGHPQVILTDEVVTRRGNVAWVTVSENMLSQGRTAVASALNIFEHSDGRWMMVAHHAGPIAMG